MKKKVLSLILALCMVFGLLPAISIPASAVDTSSMTEFTSASTIFDSGTVYKISDAANLRALATKVNAGNNMTGVTFYLAGNIDLNVGITLNSNGTFSGGVPTSWTPIGTMVSSFQGTFDGDNHTVSGIYVNGGGGNLALFGVINYAIVKNVGVINSYIKGVGNNIGGVVGYVGNGTVSNCYNAGTIISSAMYIGGVVGNAGSSSITNCHNSGTVTCTLSDDNNYVGGVVGTAGGSPVTNCYNTGSVTGSGYRVGGVAGNIDGANIGMLNCYNAGPVSGNNDVGGVTGFANRAMQNCYSAGSVNATGGLRVGGVAGYCTGAISNCYWRAGSAANGIGSGSGTNCYSFSGGGTTWTLSNSVTIGSIGPTTSLRSALNAWVTNKNNTDYLTWDTGTTYPIFGAALAPTYAMTASTLTAFASKVSGYATAPAAQTVTITNAGNQAITLNQPTATDYTISALSTTTLAVGGTATFTVQPKTGLAAGTHDEAISISGSGGTSASVSAQFTVGVGLTVVSTDIYANGNAIILAAGTTADYTCVYLDIDRDGVIDAEDTIQTIDGAPGAADATGYNLISWKIYGGKASTALAGDTKITILGGKVNSLYGGGCDAAATVVNTSVTMIGGSIDLLYGGGYNAIVSGSTNVTVSDGVVVQLCGGGFLSPSTVGSTHVVVNGGKIYNIYGGGNNGPVTGNTNVTVNSGLIVENIYGTAKGAVSGDANITVNGGSIGINIYGGGTFGTGTVAGTNIIIGGGTVKGNIDASTYVTGAKSLKITGGTIRGTLSGASPTKSDGTTPVYKTTLTLTGISAETAVSGTLTLGGLAAGYGLTDVKTAVGGVLTFYLPGGASTAAYSTNGKCYAATVAGIGSDAFVQLFSTTPTVTNATVTKTTATQAAIDFTLNTALTGTWKVYNAPTGGSLVAGVTASASSTALTLTHASDIPAGTYYVSLTEAGKTESTRLALTINTSNIATVATVKGLVQGTAYTMTQAAATSEAAVKAAIEAKIATLALNGVTPVVTKVLYTPAVAGDAGTPAGTNGTYTFTVDLSKGAASDTTATLTMTVSATAFDVAAANTASVATVKGLVEGEAYTMTLASATDEAAVEAAVEAQIATLALDGVTPIVTKVLYTPAVAGDAGTPAGTNGTYTFTVDLSKGAASETTATLSMTVTTTAYVVHHSGGGGSTLPVTPPSSGADILVNGVVVQAGTAVDTKEDGKTVTTVTIDELKLEQKLVAEGDKATVTIPVKTNSDVIIGELNGQMVKNMENKQAVVQIKTDAATYTLPAQQINIDAVSGQLGMDIELKDIKVAIEIAKPAQEIVEIVENSAKTGEFNIIAPAMEFNIRCSYNGKTIDVSKFNAYVERTIAIPEGADKSKITTGVIVDPDGTVRHVPTQIMIIDGKYYAKINSLTNSTYSVVWNPVTFKDSENHWAKEAINDIASRLVASGIGDDLFDPDRDITRAEFAAIIVRALGLKPDTGNTSFKDVSSLDWYSGYVNTAYKYNIITGYGEDLFGPSDKITREQAMTMIAKSMIITGLMCEFKSGEMEQILSEYSDSQNAAIWARENIAACIKAGIVSGKDDGTIEPNDEITRAEVAVVVRRLLQKSDLI